MNFRQTLSLVVPAFGLIACNNNLSSNTIIEAKAPDQDITVEVISGIPSSSFGPHPVRVYITQGKERDLLIRTPIFNDGKPLKKENANITFNGDSISVCLLGATPPGKLVTFNPGTKNYQVKEGSCDA